MPSEFAIDSASGALHVGDAAPLLPGAAPRTTKVARRVPVRGLTLAGKPIELDLRFEDGALYAAEWRLQRPELADGRAEWKWMMQEIELLRASLGPMLGRPFSSGMEIFPWGVVYADFKLKARPLPLHGVSYRREPHVRRRMSVAMREYVARSVVREFGELPVVQVERLRSNVRRRYKATLSAAEALSLATHFREVYAAGADAMSQFFVPPRRRYADPADLRREAFMAHFSARYPREPRKVLESIAGYILLYEHLK